MGGNSSKQTIDIECKKLTKVYRKVCTPRSKSVCALQDISFSIKAGQLVGLIGPNGAGKSTLLNLIAGLIFPTQGSIKICGYAPRSLEARRYLGYMPESPAYSGTYSAPAVLKYHGALYNMPKREIGQRTSELLEELALKDASDRPCQSFSLGMKQRLALGVALMNKPKVLLLDEPGNGLDPVGIVMLRNLLKDLANTGTAILISSHILGELEKLTNDFIFLNHGKTVLFEDIAVSDQGILLRIGVISDGLRFAQNCLTKFKIINATDTELLLSIKTEQDIPTIVSTLVNDGAGIMSVGVEKENVEETFMRLYNGGHSQ